jgi:RNA polymerase sigma factor (sigma-70 family)
MQTTRHEPADTVSQPGDTGCRTPLPDLLSAAAAGQDQAWAELVERFGRMLISVGRQRGLTADEAADAAQRTWLQLITNAHQIRQPERLAGWLATTVSRESSAVRRRRCREIPADGRDLEQTDDDLLEDGLVEHLDAAQWRKDLHRAIPLLPARERALIQVLLEPAQPSYQQISKRLGMPVGAIGPVRQRALRRLRQLLDAEHEGGSVARLRASA